MTRFRATISFEYESRGSFEAYGTTDPFEMAEVDREQAESDLGLFIDLATQQGAYRVSVKPFPEVEAAHQRVRVDTAEGPVEGQWEKTSYTPTGNVHQVRLDSGQLITTTDELQFFAAGC